jgi:hypothetical protein
MTADEVDHYLSGGSITCMLCGRGFRRLGGHLQAIHQVTEDDYRARYGLPWSRGLTCEPTRDKYRAAAKKRIEDGEMEHLAKGIPAGKNVRRHPRQPFHTEKTKQRKWLGKGMGASYGAEDFDRILDRVRSGETIRDILGTKGSPASSWFRRWLRENPQDRARLDAILDPMPFSEQHRIAYRIGPRLTEAVRDLRQQGMSDKRIAKELGLSTMTIFHRRRDAGIP